MYFKTNIYNKKKMSEILTAAYEVKEDLSQERNYLNNYLFY